MWTAYWQADGDMRYEIATTTFKHTAEFERDEFIKRMSNPEVGIWWAWVEEINEISECGHRNCEVCNTEPC